jgi:hypothetical protein
MIGGLDQNTVLASSGVVADLDGGFGIYRETKRRRVGIGGLIDPVYVFKDGVGLSNLFLGKLLRTFLG